MKYKITKNFLPTDLFEELKNCITEDKDFPWRKREHMVKDTDDALYFNYCFYNNMESQSVKYREWIIPILEKLDAAAPIQVECRFSISELYKTSSWHCDYDYSFPCKTAILYLNDCDGGTELKIDNKIIFVKADANKMLVFDSPIMHRGITSKDVPIRYIINFNYFCVNQEVLDKKF
jgi:hypothetical protein